jgi:hypothetical protein
MNIPPMNKEELLAQPGEEYMNESWQAFFKHLLINQRYEPCERHVRET